MGIQAEAAWRRTVARRRRLGEIFDVTKTEHLDDGRAVVPVNRPAVFPTLAARAQEQGRRFVRKAA